VRGACPALRRPARAPRAIEARVLDGDFLAEFAGIPALRELLVSLNLTEADASEDAIAAAVAPDAVGQ